MDMIERSGRFRGTILDHGVSATKKSGCPQFVAKLHAKEYYDEAEKEWVDWEDQDEGITGYIILFGGDGKPTFNCEDVMETFEWDGKSFVELNEMDLENVDIQFVVKEEEYEGETKFKVATVAPYDATPSTGVRKLDGDELKELDKKFAQGLKKIRKVKPKSAKSDDGDDGDDGNDNKKTETKSKKKDKKSKKSPPSVKKNKKKNKTKEAAQGKGGAKKESDQQTAWDAAVAANEDEELGAQLDDDALAELWCNTITEVCGEDIEAEDEITAEQWFVIEKEIKDALYKL